MEVMIIERLWKPDTVLRKIRESKWIAKGDEQIASRFSHHPCTISHLNM